MNFKHPKLFTLILLLSSAQYAYAAKKILFLMTSANTLNLQDGTIRQTGYFLNEFYQPYSYLKKKGFEVSLASPDGIEPTVDEESLKKKYWDDEQLREEALHFINNDSTIKNPMTIQKAIEQNSEFSAIVIPGGQGVMVDLYNNNVVPTLLTIFAETERPIGLICHSPALLLKLAENNPLKGFMVTSVSGIEEWIIEKFIMGSKPEVRKIGKKLKKAGYNHHAGFPGASHVTRDRFLVTSQNPYSGEEFNEEFDAALTEYLSKR